MLKNSKAFSSFSVDDLDKAKKFYSEVLGLEVVDEDMGGLRLKTSGNNDFYIYAKPNHEPATFTILNFLVEDIEKSVDELVSKGIKFEHYEEPMKTDEKGIYTNGDGKGSRIAWFKDPAGNFLSLMQE